MRNLSVTCVTFPCIALHLKGRQPSEKIQPNPTVTWVTFADIALHLKGRQPSWVLQPEAGVTCITFDCIGRGADTRHGSRPGARMDHARWRWHRASVAVWDGYGHRRAMPSLGMPKRQTPRVWGLPRELVGCLALLDPSQEG
jgi:hypothetical protein